MEPLRSNQTAMQVDMTSSTNQAVTKKLKSPKFVPFEPSKAAVGPMELINSKETEEEKEKQEKRPVRRKLLSSPAPQLDSQSKTLHRYQQTIYVGKDTSSQNSSQNQLRLPPRHPNTLNTSTSTSPVSSSTTVSPSPHSTRSSERTMSPPPSLPPQSVLATSSSTGLVALSTTDGLSKPDRPVNVVDPMLKYPGERKQVTGEGSRDSHVVTLEEPEEVVYTESRAVAHLQSVNEACTQRIVQLRDERTELKKELELQFQINAELKNLLVASMGDEMHHDVEMLVRQRTQLSSEIDNYCKKIQDNQEALDKMSIMADMWRSKYIASRVMVDELAGWKAQLSVRYNDSRRALNELLNERHNIKHNIIEANKYLQQVHSTMYTHQTKSGQSRQPRMTSSNLVELSKQCCHLAETVKFSLLGTVPVSVQTIETDDLTPAEKLADEVLSHGVSTGNHASCYHSNGAVSRFHPDTRFEFLTFNCCKHCKGDIFVV